MAEQTYRMPEEPVYHEAIRRLQRQDPGDAESIFNPLIQAMLENTEFVRRLAEAIAQQNAADHAAIRRETAESIGAAVAAIPTPDVSGQIAVHDGDASAHAALFNALRSGMVPTGRKINNKPLSGDISLTASDVGAAASGHTHTAAQIGALPVGGGTLTGNLRLQSGNYGLAIILGDGDYVHISEPTDDVMELKAKSIRFVTSQASGSPLPVNHGGTGVTTLNDLKSLLGAGNLQFSLWSSVPDALSNHHVALVYV